MLDRALKERAVVFEYRTTKVTLEMVVTEFGACPWTVVRDAGVARSLTCHRITQVSI